jgi:hypothetical protein
VGFKADVSLKDAISDSEAAGGDGLSPTEETSLYGDGRVDEVFSFTSIGRGVLAIEWMVDEPSKMRDNAWALLRTRVAS